MKHLFYLFIFIPILVFGQDTAFKISKRDFKDIVTRDHGTCNYYDSSKVISGDPSSYEWLQNNGYCYTDDFGTSVDICWVLEPSGDSIEVNSGYSQDCKNNFFFNFALYDASCNLVGTGFNFSVTPGNTYYWCFETFANGGPDCDTGYTNFCPYYEEFTVLPVKLTSFETNRESHRIKISWTTASESNSDHFKLLRRTENSHWTVIDKLKAAGTSTISQNYSTIDHHKKTTYYKLLQYDRNGYKEVYGPIVSKTDKDSREPRKVINIMGQEVNKNYKGIKLYIYE